MAAVKDMPPSVRATIQSSGPYDRPRSERVDVAPFITPVDAPLGSYAVLGSQAATGCTALSCAGEPNDGLGWVSEVPRVLLGIAGLETRPGG